MPQEMVELIMFSNIRSHLVSLKLKFSNELQNLKFDSGLNLVHKIS